jgi:hypothetical protein
MAGITQQLPVPPPVDVQTILYNTYLQILASSTPFTGALDLLTSPTVAFAVSPQRLWSTFTGSSMRLRSDGIGSPESDFGFTASGNLDTAAIASWLTNTSGSNAYCRTFYDQSGNSRDAGQSTAASQPLYATGSLGRGQLTFDGANDCLDTASWSLAQSFTIWQVLDTADSDVLSYSCGTLGSTPTFGGVYRVGFQAGAYFGSSDAYVSNVWSLDTLTYQIYKINGASSSVQTNSASSGTLNFGTTGINGGWRLGNRFDAATGWAGKIVEQIIFAGDATALTGWAAFVADRKTYYSLL